MTEQHGHAGVDYGHRAPEVVYWAEDGSGMPIRRFCFRHAVIACIGAHVYEDVKTGLAAYTTKGNTVQDMQCEDCLHDEWKLRADNQDAPTG